MRGRIKKHAARKHRCSLVIVCSAALLCSRTEQLFCYQVIWKTNPKKLIVDSEILVGSL